MLIGKTGGRAKVEAGYRQYGKRILDQTCEHGKRRDTLRGLKLAVAQLQRKRTGKLDHNPFADGEFLGRLGGKPALDIGGADLVGEGRNQDTGIEIMHQ